MFIVVRLDKHPVTDEPRLSASNTPFRHPTQQDAETEAQRLSVAHGSTYVVMGALSITSCPPSAPVTVPFVPPTVLD